MTYKLAVEVMDSSQAWQDYTSDIMEIKIDGLGLNDPRGFHSRTAHGKFRFNNESRNYSPDVASRLAAQRRIRLKVTDAEHGKILRVEHDGIGDNAYFKQAVTTSTSISDVWVLTWDARSAFGDFWNQDKVYLVTSAESQTPVTYTYTNKWASYSLSFTAASNATTIEPRFRWYQNVDQSNSRYIEYKNIQLKKNGGVNVLVNGDFATGSSSPFAVTNVASVSVTGAEYTSGNQDSDVALMFDTSTKTKLVQSFVNSQYVAFNCDQVQLYLKKVGSPTGTLTLRVETDNNNLPSGTLLHANATDTVTESSLSTSYGLISFTMSAFSIPYNVRYWLVLTTDRAASGTNYVVWGADASSPSYASGEMKSLDSFITWTAENKDAVFNVTGTRNSTASLAAVTDDYLIKWNGRIKSVIPAPHQRGGILVTDVLSVDFTDDLRNKKIDLALQKNKKAGELAATVLDQFTQRNSVSSLIGRSLDTGVTTFARAFDGYTKENTTALIALDEAARSEYGAQWIDTDGTVRLADRNFIPERTQQAVSLSLTDGDPYVAYVDQDSIRLINKCNIVYHPRQTIAITVVLGQITSAIDIPPVKPNGSPGEREIVLTYRDDSGRFIGGDSFITPLVATTDYLINESSTGTSVDYTTSPRFSLVSVTPAATQATIKMSNTAAGTLWATKLQIRGNAVTTYDPITLTQIDQTSIDQYGEVEYTLDLPFNNDPIFATNLGIYLVSRYLNPYSEIQYVSSNWRDQLGGVNVMRLELMDLIGVTDYQIGFTNVKHCITNMDYIFTPQSGVFIGNVTMSLTRQDDTLYWTLEDATLGVLGTTTKLYI